MNTHTKDRFLVHVNRSLLKRVNDMSIARFCLLAGFMLVSPILYFGFQILVLEPLGFLDIHVSQVPEWPNGCVKITEERYRYCWDERDILFDNELGMQVLSDNRLP